MATLPTEPTAPLAQAPPALSGSPLDPADRVVTLDAVRGFALLGILVVNAGYFAMPTAWVEEPLYYGPHSELDLRVWSAIDVFAAGKFITLFSTLFGAGIWLMMARADERGHAVAGTHYKRMAWLLLFGFVHAYLVWSGDILVSYALAGMVLYPMCRLSVRWQLTIAAALLVVGSFFMAAWSGAYWLWQAFDPEGYAAFEPFPEEDIEAEIQAYRGGFITQALWRVPEAMVFQVLLIVLFGPWYLAMMLVGVALARTSILAGSRLPRLYWGALLAGLLVGLPVTVAAHLWQWQAEELDFASSMLLLQLHYWVAPLVGYGYAAGLILLIRRGALRGATDMLAAVGRMALTNYLLQSLLMTAIFYGHGLGLFASRGFLGVAPFVAGIWMLQLAVSPWWLARFRFGPMEWLWRSLTYGKAQPMRLAAV